MKRTYSCLKMRSLKLGLCALPAAALMLGASQGGQIGINFQTDYSGYASYSGKRVTATAFNIDPTNWFNMPPASTTAPTAASESITLPGGGVVLVSWTCQNGYVSSIDATDGTNVPPGFDEVVWGYLDDTSPGWTCTLSGLRSIGTNYTLQAISASDAVSGFADINLLTNGVIFDTLNFTNDPSQFVQVDAHGYGTSTVSQVFVTLNGNDSVKLVGVGRNGTIRNTLAGLIVTYADPSTNPPLVETNPVPPAGLLFPAGSFTLTAAASGALPLSYQWQFAGANISGATDASYTKSGTVVGDSGAYDVVVANAFGTVTSTVANITIQNVSQPQITVAPLSQTFFAGYPVTFAATAIGGQLSYIWEHAGTPIAGATNSTLSLSGITTNDAGTYTLIVSNSVGTASASAILTVLFAPAPYPAAVAAALPLVYYRLSETGTLPYNSAANIGSLGSDGIGAYLGASTHPVAGALVGSTDTAASFDGASGRVAVPFSASLNTPTFTGEAWVKPGVAVTGTTLTCVLSCGDFVSPRAGWLIYQDSLGWELRMYDQDATTFTADVTNSSILPVPGTWYHLAVTFDGTTPTIYVNGVGASGTLVDGPYVPGTAGPLAVGCRADSTFFWSGAEDEVALYSTALSPEQILAHYQNGTNAARSTPYQTLIAGDSPVEYLRLDDPAFGGNSINLGTSGALENATYSTTGASNGQPGPRPPEFPGFDATNNAVDLSTGSVQAPALNLVTDTVSMVAWLYLNGDNVDYFPGIMFTRPSATGISLDAADDLDYTWNNDAGTYGFASGLAVPPNEWVMVGLVVTPTNATLYLGTTNGLQYAVNTHNHAVHDFTTSPLVLGFDNGNYLIGSIDEAALFPYALTQDQMTALLLTATGQPLKVSMTLGGVIVDSKPVGAPLDGFDGGATWLPSAGPDGNNYTRTGVEQFNAAGGAQITVPTNSAFNSTVGTISFWMNYTVPLAGFPGPGNEAAILFDRRTASGTLFGISTTGGIEFQAANGANSFTTGYVPDGNWHQVTITYDQSAAGSVSIYIDGVLSQSNPNTAAWSWPATQEIELGRSHDSYWLRYDGQLDDFRIYNRILTDTEVATIAAPSTSDSLIDNNALVVRYNFDTIGAGYTLNWPYGTLYSSPVLGPSAVWTPVPGAINSYSFLPDQPSLFFRVKL